MNHRAITGIALLALVTAACGTDPLPENSFLLEVQYNDALKLETVELVLGDQSDSVPISHQIVVLLPEPGEQITQLDVWGRKAGKRAAYGLTLPFAFLANGKGFVPPVVLTACSPGCRDGMLVTCGTFELPCPNGCSGDDDFDGINDAHCNE